MRIKLKIKKSVASPLATGVPSEVVSLALTNDYAALCAWREYLGLTQHDVAKKLGISQSAYSQLEQAPNLKKPLV